MPASYVTPEQYRTPERYRWPDGYRWPDAYAWPGSTSGEALPPAGLGYAATYDATY